MVEVPGVVDEAVDPVAVVEPMVVALLAEAGWNCLVLVLESGQS